VSSPSTRKKPSPTPRSKSAVRARPMKLDEITLADLAKPAEVRALRKLSAQVRSGKRRVRYV
jgi:hypothetical protein